MFTTMCKMHAWTHAKYMFIWHFNTFMIDSFFPDHERFIKKRGNILVIIHKRYFYPSWWTSTFNPFMNDLLLPVHEQIIKSKPRDFLGYHWWKLMFAKVFFLLIHERFIKSVEKTCHNLRRFFDNCSWMVLLTLFMNITV